MRITYRLSAHGFGGREFAVEFADAGGQPEKLSLVRAFWEGVHGLANDYMTCEGSGFSDIQVRVERQVSNGA